MDEGGKVCGIKGVATACRQYRLPFDRFVEGEEVILPRLQVLVLWDYSVPLGAVLGEGFRLEERGGCGGREKVVRKGEAGALRLFLSIPETV